MAFDVQNIYSTPQIPRKRPCLRPRRMTLIDLRNVRVDEDDDQPYRKCSTATIRSEGTGTQYYAKHGGIQPMYDSSDNSSLDSCRSSTASSMRIRRVSSSFDGSTRFPRLQECAHFHYDVVELSDFVVTLCDEEQENLHHTGEEDEAYLIRISCGGKTWMVKRTHKNFVMLDRQLHKCIFDRKFSRLPDLQKADGIKSPKEMELFLQSYLKKFSDITGSMINCGSVLNWFELDNRGNRLLVVDDSGINTPAIAAAHAIKRYTAQSVDEISLEVGDIVSVIDMPSPDDTIWWRGKRGFEVGFFPNECVEVIGEKIPPSVQTMVPLNSNIVRKHGKFLSFLRMFFSTRPARNQLKQSGIVKERVFGCDLGEHLLNSGHEVPLVLKCCSEFIEEFGIVDGIYRLSGITSNIQKLRLAFDEDRVPDLTEEVYLQDIHSISSLLKMYFRELPNPLLTYALYDKFADAVRDEDNKLWKIHDVVQQLPPPHYRTTEYLMRHLAKVAAYGKETGMHSKNLAIVWAPNLLRSKELECGGGAAALQGVGIQAVVTECLILYADLIFSDKLPSYSSPELRQSRKKPRPKSLAISTPTKLITLEEARERALSASLRPPHQKYIDVGGGPKTLPERYHTVLDLPGYRKKGPLKEVGNLKNKKSPSGWRSIFSKGSRQNSMKHKGQKGGLSDSLGTGMEQKAITEEDVHNWKRRRLRGAKSAESLLVLPQSSHDSRRMSRLIDESMLMKMFEEEESKKRLGHKRSLSSESPRSLAHSENSVSYPSFIVAGSREVPIDVDQAKNGDSENENTEGQRQSFIRNETKRRVVSHRRTPSAPLSPKLDSESRDKSRSPKLSKQKGISQSVIEIEHRGSQGLRENLMSSSIDAEKFVLHVDDKELLKPNRSPSNDDRKVRNSKSPPSDRKAPRLSPKEKKTEEKSHLKTDHKKDQVIDLPESPGAKRKIWLNSSSSTPATTPEELPPHYFLRNHDYAEISKNQNSDDEVNSKAQNNSSESFNLSAEQSANRLSDNYDNVDNAMFYLPNENLDGLSSMDSTFENTHAAYSYSDNGTQYSSVEFSQSKPSDSISKMAKCLSVPSDIQKSLENMNSGSTTDLLSSITLSEVSTSMDSFSLSEENSSSVDRKRRSASLDSLTESPLTRTLIEINAQIDQAFKKEVQKAKKLKEENNSISQPICSQGQDSNFVDRPVAEVQVVETPRLIRSPLRPKDIQTHESPKLSTQYSGVHTPEESLVSFSGASFDESNASKIIADLQAFSHSHKQDSKSTQNSHAYSMSPVSSPEMSRQGISPLTSPVQRRPRRSQSNTPNQHWQQDSPVSSPGMTRSGIGSNSPFMSPSSPDQSMDFDSQQRKVQRRGKVTFDLSEEDLFFLSQQGKKQDALKRSDSCSSSSTVSSISSPESKTKQSVKSESQQSFVPKHSAKRDFPQLLLSSNNMDNKSTSSPRSPRNQPRWEDLAGLNQDFRAMAGLDKKSIASHENASTKHTDNKSLQNSKSDSLDSSFEKKLQDLSNFNDVWKHQLAPTGDVCRLTDTNVSQEQIPMQKSEMIAKMDVPLECKPRERTPECGTDERTLVLEKPMIKKCLTDSNVPEIKHCSIMTQDSSSTSSSSDMPSGISQNMQLCDPGTNLASIVIDNKFSENVEIQVGLCRTDSYHRAMGKQGIENHQEKTPEPKLSNVQKNDSKNIVLDMPVLPPLELSGFPKFENSGEIPITGASNMNRTCDNGQYNEISDAFYESDIPHSLGITDSFYDNTDLNPFGSQHGMMEEFDVNESCFGIPTHQNLSNEMREKMQERLKGTDSEGNAFLSDRIPGSLIIQEKDDPIDVDDDFTSTHCMDVESSMQFSSEYTSITRPAEDQQVLSQGPLITAAPFIVEQIEPVSQLMSPIDNSEEEAQNAINADKELNMTLQTSLNQNTNYVPTPDSEHVMDENVVQSNIPLPQLPPPEQEFLEVRRPCVVKTKFHMNSSEGSSERGENQVIVQHRASFKKKAPVPLPVDKSARASRKSTEEYFDFSDVNDDVFVDDVKSNITCSKLVRTQYKSVAEKCISRSISSLDDPPNRSSLDESILQMASSRHDNFSNDESDASKKEDVRFTKAHKSAKLQSLKELFEKSCSEISEKQRSKPKSQEGLVCLPNPQCSSEVQRISNARGLFAKQKSFSSIERSTHEPMQYTETTASSAVSDIFNIPGSRRSISTDIGYEFQSTKPTGFKSERVGMGKPPKHRNVSKTRTASESSMCESDQRTVRSSPRSLDGSPKFAREGSLSSKSSPKSQRDSSPFSQVSSEDSPRGIRRRSEENSPKSIRHQSSEEGSPKGVRMRLDGSPRGVRHVSFQSEDLSISSQQQSPKSHRSASMEIKERMTKSCSVLNSQASSSRTSESSDLMTRSLTLEHSHSLEEGSTYLKRRGSIKELMHFFEKKKEGGEEDSSAVQGSNRQRVHSVSPTIGLSHTESRSRESLAMINVRHSLELPSGANLSNLEGLIRPQPVRMGPKPFYSVRNT